MKLHIKSKNPQKELNVFMWAAVLCLIGCIFLSPFLAVAAIPLSGRGMMLTFHPKIKNEYYIPRVRAVLAIVFIGSVWWLLTR